MSLDLEYFCVKYLVCLKHDDPYHLSPHCTLAPHTLLEISQCPDDFGLFLPIYLCSKMKELEFSSKRTEEQLVTDVNNATGLFKKAQINVI